jgi:hypothetical protein
MRKDGGLYCIWKMGVAILAEHFTFGEIDVKP